MPRRERIEMEGGVFRGFNLKDASETWLGSGAGGPEYVPGRYRFQVTRFVMPQNPAHKGIGMEVKVVTPPSEEAAYLKDATQEIWYNFEDERANFVRGLFAQLAPWALWERFLPEEEEDGEQFLNWSFINGGPDGKGAIFDADMAVEKFSRRKRKGRDEDGNAIYETKDGETVWEETEAIRVKTGTFELVEPSTYALKRLKKADIPPHITVDPDARKR